MLKKIFIFVILIIELLVQSQWFLCKRFKDFIHLSSLDQNLYLKGLLDNDSGVPQFIVRFFHNKIIVFLDIFVKYYLRFWDDRFLLNLFSIVGCFGIILGIWYLLTRNYKHKKYLWLIFIFLLILPLFEIVFEPKMDFIYKIIFLTLPFQIFSIFGIWQFLRNNSIFRLGIIYCLMLLSIWWINVLQADIFNYCVR